MSLSLDQFFLQIRGFNPKDQFKPYIQSILEHLSMIHTMQLFNFIESRFRNLMNLLSLHYSSHLRKFEEKNSQNSINQSIGSTYLVKSKFISLKSKSP